MLLFALALGTAAARTPWFVPPPDLEKNWLVHGAHHRGARAGFASFCSFGCSAAVST